MGPREQFYLSLEIELNKLKPKKKENFVIDAVKYRDILKAHPLPPVSNLTLAPRSIEDVVLSFGVEPTTAESDHSCKIHDFDNPQKKTLSPTHPSFKNQKGCGNALSAGGK